MYNSLEHPAITRVLRYGLPVVVQPLHKCKRCGMALPLKDEHESLCEDCKEKVRSRFADLMDNFSTCELEYIDDSLDGVSVLDWMKGAM